MINHAFPYNYQIVRTTNTLESTTYTAFGVSLISLKDNTEIKRFEDITTSQSQLETLVLLCNQLQLDPIHFRDVIQDFIS